MVGGRWAAVRDGSSQEGLTAKLLDGHSFLASKAVGGLGITANWLAGRAIIRDASAHERLTAILLDTDSSLASIALGGISVAARLRAASEARSATAKLLDGDSSLAREALSGVSFTALGQRTRAIAHAEDSVALVLEGRIIDEQLGSAPGSDIHALFACHALGRKVVPNWVTHASFFAHLLVATRLLLQCSTGRSISYAEDSEALFLERRIIDEGAI